MGISQLIFQYFFKKKTGWHLLHGDQTLQKANGKIHYWEIWEEAEQNKLFIHLGLVGKRGEAFENATAQFTVATSAQDQPE
jgi:hypothetical protein